MHTHRRRFGPKSFEIQTSTCLSTHREGAIAHALAQHTGDDREVAGRVPQARAAKAKRPVVPQVHSKSALRAILRGWLLANQP